MCNVESVFSSIFCRVCHVEMCCRVSYRECDVEYTVACVLSRVYRVLCCVSGLVSYRYDVVSSSMFSVMLSIVSRSCRLSFWKCVTSNMLRWVYPVECRVKGVVSNVWCQGCSVVSVISNVSCLVYRMLCRPVKCVTLRMCSVKCVVSNASCRRMCCMECVIMSDMFSRQCVCDRVSYRFWAFVVSNYLSNVWCWLCIVGVVSVMCRV